MACTLLVSVVTLIYFLPRESKFGYVYELNKPWHYPQLIASYDIVIYKTDDEVKRERDSVVRQFVPYYRVDSLVAEKQRIGFLQFQRVEGFRRIQRLVEGDFDRVAVAPLHRFGRRDHQVLGGGTGFGVVQRDPIAGTVIAVVPDQQRRIPVG